MYTGWGKYWGDRKRYLGTDEPGYVTDCGTNVPVFENLAALDRLPPVGATIFALPMKIRGGSCGPLPIFALLP